MKVSKSNIPKRPFWIAGLIGIVFTSHALAAGYKPPSAEVYFKKQVEGYIPIQESRGPVPVEVLKIVSGEETPRGKVASYDRYFKKPNNQSAIVMKDGKIIYETYNSKWKGAKDFPINGQSMTKVITGMTVGALLCSGKIKSLDDTMGEYSETLKGSSFSNVTIRRALQMRSGIRKFNDKEGWDLWWMVTANKKEGYEGKNFLKKYIKTVKSQNGNGKVSEYHPSNSFALSILAHDVTGSSLASNFNSEIFSKINPSANAYWMTDAEGITIPNAGLFMTTLDWAKVGNFVQSSISEGNCMGEFFTEGIKSASKSSTSDNWKYGNHFWTKSGYLIFAGFGGQAMYVNPKTSVVVMASSVNPKYGNDFVFNIAETVVKEAGK